MTTSIDPLALASAGWRPEDLQWEALQERAAETDSAGDHDGAAQLRSEALRLARATFPANDPRLAASLANQALAMRREGKDALVADLLAEARQVWQAAGAWIAAMKPERRARSSTFHLRLESKHKGAYDHFGQERAQALADEGRAALQALHDAPPPQDADDRLSRWRRDKPAAFSDQRKLMAAVLLIAAG